MRLNYAIKFVSDMDAAVAFYRDTLGLTLSFQSPFWSEFDTGETSWRSTLLRRNPAGSRPARPLDLAISIISTRPAQAEGLVFTSPPTDRPRNSNRPIRRYRWGRDQRQRRLRFPSPHGIA